ncbi:hypothetical protein POM88_040541 [Heracleum sosnowskyi]|uniref:DUF4371 domain-containing protein n=1 Tax=Heracleum sosnowskyi TaxID=360622 RepID=A0AAD8M7H5_9APIA|nr:hypothetical protein POM88_040541 [Heracleum sosnowskyi]
MERFFKRKLPDTLNDTDLPWDPFDRKRIIEYHPDQRDEIRRAYLIRGPCQPLGQEFPKTKIGNKDRRFNPECVLPFRGHDESEKSLHRGNFLEMIKYTQNQNEMVRKVTLKNAPANNQMVSPKIQKDICHCFAQEILKSIIKEIGDDVFALLVDESCDVSKKEQMAVVLRYVDDTCGVVNERFVGLVHGTFSDPSEMHDLVRADDIQVLFSVCDTEQLVARTCTSCGVNMGQYFCAVCRYDTDKLKFHCDARDGGGGNFFHCNKCGSLVDMMIAGWDEKGPGLYCMHSDVGLFKGDRFAIGSGCRDANVVLDIGYRYDMTIDEAVELAQRSIYHATFARTASVYYVGPDGYKKLSCDDVAVLHYEYYP